MMRARPASTTISYSTIAGSWSNKRPRSHSKSTSAATSTQANHATIAFFLTRSHGIDSLTPQNKTPAVWHVQLQTLSRIKHETQHTERCTFVLLCNATTRPAALPCQRQLFLVINNNRHIRCSIRRHVLQLNHPECFWHKVNDFKVSVAVWQGKTWVDVTSLKWK